MVDEAAPSCTEPHPRSVLQGLVSRVVLLGHKTLRLVSKYCPSQLSTPTKLELNGMVAGGSSAFILSIRETQAEGHLHQRCLESRNSERSALARRLSAACRKSFDLLQSAGSRRKQIRGGEPGASRSDHMSRGSDRAP